MSERFRIIDCDGHILEREEDIRLYLEPPFDGRGTQLWGQPDQPWDSRLFQTLGLQDKAIRLTAAEAADAWLRVMDEQGIEAAVIFPTGAGNMAGLRERDFARAVTRAYNDYVAREYAARSPRLLPVGVLPLRYPQDAAEELRRAREELGLVSFELIAMNLKLPLGDDFYDPLYAEAERLDVPLCVHASRTPAAELGAGDMTTFAEVHAYCMMASIQLQFTSILFKGVPTRFPRLRLAFLEVGASWVVPYLDRLDEHWSLRGRVECPDLPRRPSDVVREMPYYFSIEPGETLLPETVAFLGAQHFMYASDYPHWDSEFPHNIDELRDHPRLTDADKTRIFYDNARELYALNVPAKLGVG